MQTPEQIKFKAVGVVAIITIAAAFTALLLNAIR